MVRTIRTVSISNKGYNSRKVARSRQLVNKAAQLLRQRSTTVIRAPLRTGGYSNINRRGLSGPELKTIDVTATGAITTAGTVTLLNGIATGTDITNRIGRKVLLRSILFRLDVYPITTANNPAGNFVRALVVYDYQTNSTAPTVTDVLQAATYNSPMNLANRDRFKVLIDKNIIVGPNSYTAGALTTGDPRPSMNKVYKKLYLDEIFGDVDATVASIKTGSIVLLLIARYDAVTASNLYSRIRFIDN